MPWDGQGTGAESFSVFMNLEIWATLQRDFIRMINSKYRTSLRISNKMRKNCFVKECKVKRQLSLKELFERIACILSFFNMHSTVW